MTKSKGKTSSNTGIIIAGVSVSVAAAAAIGGAAIYNVIRNKKKPAKTPDIGHLHIRESKELLEHRLLSTPAAKQWQLIGIRNHHGVAVPLFSMKTESSCGVGEYLDLIPLIDCCHAINMDVIQLLPLHDTDESNSPFSPVSCFSLNPYYLSMKKLPNFEKQTKEMSDLIEELVQLNKEERVDWKKVRALKDSWFQMYFDLEETQQIIKSDEFSAFCKENEYWLPCYSLFCSLRDKNKSSDWQYWDAQTYDSSLSTQFTREIVYHNVLQYLCAEQMKQVKAHADFKRVFLKGDLPFMVSKNSADVWCFKHLFDLNYTAGAPPDIFSAKGQNWGLPLYNWDEMAKDDYTWWKMRLRVAEKYYHLYRLDHIVGFYRTWAVPIGAEATEGSFIPHRQAAWIPQGERILAVLLRSSTMLPIGEDLGAVPMQVKKSLQRLGICGTKVIRWERQWDKTNQPYTFLSDYNADSMTTVSTHDTQTLEGWWTSTPTEVREFCKMKRWDYVPQLSPKLRLEILKDAHHSASLFHINLLSEYLSLESKLIDSTKARINTPGTIGEDNWSWRMRPTMESLCQDRKFVEDMKHIVS